MNESFLTPILLNDNPELAALRILTVALEVSEVALLATYPASEPSRDEHRRTEQEAYAISVLHQIDALGAMLAEYTESIRRLRERRSQEHFADDIEF